MSSTASTIVPCSASSARHSRTPARNLSDGPRPDAASSAAFSARAASVRSRQVPGYAPGAPCGAPPISANSRWMSLREQKQGKVGKRRNASS